MAINNIKPDNIGSEKYTGDYNKLKGKGDRSVNEIKSPSHVKVYKSNDDTINHADTENRLTSVDRDRYVDSKDVDFYGDRKHGGGKRFLVRGSDGVEMERVMEIDDSAGKPNINSYKSDPELSASLKANVYKHKDDSNVNKLGDLYDIDPNMIYNNRKDSPAD